MGCYDERKTTASFIQTQRDLMEGKIDFDEYDRRSDAEAKREVDRMIPIWNEQDRVRKQEARLVLFLFIGTMILAGVILWLI